MNINHGPKIPGQVNVATLEAIEFYPEAKRTYPMVPAQTL